MLAGCTAVMAQENRFSAGLELGLPMGDWADFVGFGIGATLGYELPVGDHLGVIAQAGYINFSGKDITVDLGPLGSSTIEGASMAAIPIQIGAKYYFSDNQEGAYLGLLTGVHIMSSSAEGAESSTNFGLAPTLGFFVTENIDIALRFQMLFDKYETVEMNGLVPVVVEETRTNSYLGVRAAYVFGSR